MINFQENRYKFENVEDIYNSLELNNEIRRNDDLCEIKYLCNSLQKDRVNANMILILETQLILPTNFL